MPEEDDLIVLPDGQVAMYIRDRHRKFFGTSAVGSARILWRARDAARLTGAEFTRVPDGELLASGLSQWLISSHGWVRGPAIRLFRSCSVAPIRRELERILPTLPDDLHYELAELVALVSPESDAAAAFRARLRRVNDRRLQRGLGRLGVEEQRLLAKGVPSG